MSRISAWYAHPDTPPHQPVSVPRKYSCRPSARPRPVTALLCCQQRADANLAAVIYLFTHFPHMRFTAVRTHVEGAFDVGYDEVMRQGA